NDHEHSFNCGVEGPTDDPEILSLRFRQIRNFLATLFLSQGTPMLLGGDEVARTQRGNNNCYCQDNELSWFEWTWTEQQRQLFTFTRRLIELRKRHPALRRAKFFQGRPIQNTDFDGLTLVSLRWRTDDGR
ncbi:MAG: glycogen debranching enzyme GlgX, partial [Polyangiaceae bacterium]